jgi:hypothetical protein
MDSVVKFKTHRSDYDIRESMSQAITVNDLIAILECYPSDAKVVFDNDSGYTFGGITGSCVRLADVETYEEEKERELREQIQADQEEAERTIGFIKKRVNKNGGELILAMDGILLSGCDLLVTELTTKINGRLYGNTTSGLIDLELIINDLDDWYTLILLGDLD